MPALGPGRQIALSAARTPYAAGISRPPRADQPPRPFVKWAGGKSQLLAELTRLVPPSFGRYIEPFVGGGALYFALRPKRALLGDINQQLITAYRVVQRQVEALIALLAGLKRDSTTYYRVRATPWQSLAPVAQAARLIYLNRTCFNGLWRVNRQGHFNVPFGHRHQQGTVCNANLRRASCALAGARLEAQPAATLCRRARPGDLVYLDPPYHRPDGSSSFVAYTTPPFTEDHQRELADRFARLAARGVHVMLSNADTPLIRQLYRNFRIHPLSARRAISRLGSGRGPVPEVVVTWQPPAP